MAYTCAIDRVIYATKDFHNLRDHILHAFQLSHIQLHIQGFKIWIPSDFTALCSRLFGLGNVQIGKNDASCSLNSEA